MEKQRYVAFITYAHEDERWAAWVHRALERYRIPRVLRSAARRGALRPIFRDRDELGHAGDLSDALVDALSRSDALIVICSPAAARSRWVNEEVRTFRELNPRATVLPVLVDGRAGIPTEVYPPALLQGRAGGAEQAGAEPLAIDLRANADGRANGRLKLVAGLLGVPFDQVRMRERQWRRQQRVVAGAFVAAIVAIAGTTTYYLTREPPCVPQPLLYAGLWSDADRARVQAAFVGTGLPFADRVWTRVDADLSQYANAWSHAHVAACEATRVHKQQSAELFDRRMACLEERREGFVALREEFATHAESTLEHAIEGVGTLRSLDRCADLVALEAQFPPPEDPELAARVAALGLEIAETRARLYSGNAQQALAAAVALANTAAETAHAPVEADALLLLGEGHLQAGEPSQARDSFYRAAAKAVQAKDGELAAAAWLEVPAILMATRGDFTEARNLLDLAGSYVAALLPTHPLRGRLLAAEGKMRAHAGRPEEGIPFLEQSIEFARSHDAYRLPLYLQDLAWVLVSAYRLQDAMTASEEALALARDRYGPHHPTYAEALKAQARVLGGQGDSAGSLARFEQALAIERAIYPENHQKIVADLNNIAWDLKNLGRYDEAQAVLDESLGLQETQSAPSWSTLGATHNAYGDLFLSRGDYARARMHMEQTVALWSKPGAEHPNVSVALNNLGNLSNREGRHAEAQATCERATNMDERNFGSDYAGLAYPLSCLGEAYLGLGETASAIRVLERAHSLREREGEDPLKLAWSRWLLGRALWEGGIDRDRARGYLAFAHAQFVEHGAATAMELEDVRRWLADNAVDL